MKKTIVAIIALLCVVVVAQATLYTTNWTVNAAIPDGDANGWVSQKTVDTMPAGTFQSVSVNLTLSGGWNGDLFAYLVNDTGFCVLLDRVGMGESGVGAYGYGDAGMNNILLSDSGSVNIHAYGGGNTFSSIPANATFLPDDSAITIANAGSLASFLGGSPNGTWTLFVADLSAGSVTTVQEWGLQMDIVAVPEVETWIAAALAGAFGAFWINRQIWSGISKR